MASASKQMCHIFHIDRGINAANELNFILSNLKDTPKDFDETIAEELLRISEIIKECFYDCHRNSQIKYLSYDEMIKKQGGSDH